MPAIKVTLEDREAARIAIRRGAKAGEPIPKCTCFQDGDKGLLERVSGRCNGVCEDAVDHVSLAIAMARLGDKLVQ